MDHPAVQCTLCTLCTVHCVQCTQCTVHCIVQYCTVKLYKLSEYFTDAGGGRVPRRNGGRHQRDAAGDAGADAHCSGRHDGHGTRGGGDRPDGAERVARRERDHLHAVHLALALLRALLHRARLDPFTLHAQPANVHRGSHRRVGRAARQRGGPRAGHLRAPQ